MELVTNIFDDYEDKAVRYQREIQLLKNDLEQERNLKNQLALELKKLKEAKS